MDGGEIWMPVRENPDYYEISSHGRLRLIKPLGGREPGHIFAPRKSGKYLGWVLISAQNKAHRTVHRLVADAFLGPIPNKMQVRHKDGNRWNNHLSNLEIGTKAEAHAHAYSISGTQPNRAPGVSNPNAKLNWELVDAIRAAHSSGSASYKILARRYGVSHVLIGEIIHGRIWQERDRPESPESM